MLVRTNTDYVSRKVGGDHILIPVGEEVVADNNLLMLNETGSFVWDHAQEPIEVDELIRLARQGFDAPEGEIEGDIQMFVQALITLGMMRQEE